MVSLLNSGVGVGVGVGVGAGAGGQHQSVSSTSLGYIRTGSNNIAFGSLTVNENSSTPYTDATQVSA